MLQGISNNNAVPFVRVPWNEPGIIMKMLDLGVMGIIAPMINTKNECENFVSYCNYPPRGQRSFGPMRAQLIYGSDYHDNANDQIISLAMIETKEAVENIDEILSVPNLTGVYIGPGDMSSSYGLKPQFDVKEDPVYANIKMIAKKAMKNGKIAGIHNPEEQLRIAISDGSAIDKFRQMVKAHGGSLESLDNPETHKPLFRQEVCAETEGYISFMNTFKLGKAVVHLGGGRLHKEDTLDPTVGIVFHKKVGDSVYEGEPLLEYFCSDKDKFKSGKLYFKEAIQIKTILPEKIELIYG